MTTLAALLPGLKKVTVFTSSGTWVKPADLRFAMVEVIGGGGGGAGNSSTGTTGGTTSFGALLSATGGTGGIQSNTINIFVAGGTPGLGSLGDINFYGSNGGPSRYSGSLDDYQDGYGGVSHYNPYGRGGMGLSSGFSARGGGGAGGYARRTLDATALADTVTVTVGAAGVATGIGGSPPPAGAGLVVIYEYA
jgi:hypothetical protein